MSAITGRIAYHAGTSGTVALEAGERILHVRAYGAAGGKLTIDGGDDIAIPALYIFDDAIDSYSEEWTASTLVFTNTLSYFVKTKKKNSP